MVPLGSRAPRSSEAMLVPVIIFSLLVSLVQGATEGKPNLIIKTSSGSVRGYLDTTTTPDTPLLKWLGIPFAQDTAGQNRWKPPQPVRPSRDIFDASNYGPACLQGRYVCHFLYSIDCHVSLYSTC